MIYTDLTQYGNEEIFKFHCERKPYQSFEHRLLNIKIHIRMFTSYL